MNADISAAREILASIDYFAGQAAVLAPLAGVQSLNNSAWSVSVGAERYFLRIANPDAQSHLGVRRTEEEAAARAAAAAGVGPEVLYYSDSGTMVTTWIESRPSWEPSDFRDPSHLERVADVVRRMHGVTDVPGDDSSAFRRIDRLLANALDLRLALPPRLPVYRRRLGEIELDTSGVVGLNHNDLWANNLLDDGRRLWLVDWEFAGRGNGLYDLATISMAGDFSLDDDRRLLAECGADSDLGALASMKWVVSFFEAAWSLVMHGRHASGFDYLGHSQRMFAALDNG